MLSYADVNRLLKCFPKASIVPNDGVEVSFYPKSGIVLDLSACRDVRDLKALLLDELTGEIKPFKSHHTNNILAEYLQKGINLYCGISFTIPMFRTIHNSFQSRDSVLAFIDSNYDFATLDNPNWVKDLLYYKKSRQCKKSYPLRLDEDVNEKLMGYCTKNAISLNKLINEIGERFVKENGL